MPRSRLQRTASLLSLVAVTIVFAWVVWPYLGAIFWAVVIAIVSAPLHRRALRIVRHRPGGAALATLLTLVAGVGVPLAVVCMLVVRQGSAFYAEVASGKIDFAAYLRRATMALPSWVTTTLQDLGLGDLAAVEIRLLGSAGAAGRFIGTHVFSVSVGSLGFLLACAVMLYLLFFLLRDGTSLAASVERAVPLAEADKQLLISTFTTVVRATVKGGLVMAATQGVLGGLVLGLLGIPAPVLWGAVFGVLSTVPVIGAGLLWVPIAIYFLLTGAVWKAFTLIVFGTVVLTVIDNVLRPLLVGKDTQMPSYLVLISTLGGAVSFGLNGVVIGPVAAALFVAVWTLFSSESADGRAANPSGSV